jgi:hypothetical protein
MFLNQNIEIESKRFVELIMAPGFFPMMLMDSFEQLESTVALPFRISRTSIQERSSNDFLNFLMRTMMIIIRPPRQAPFCFRLDEKGSLYQTKDKAFAHQEVESRTTVSSHPLQSTDMLTRSYVGNLME